MIKVALNCYDNFILPVLLVGGGEVVVILLDMDRVITEYVFFSPSGKSYQVKRKRLFCVFVNVRMCERDRYRERTNRS